VKSVSVAGVGESAAGLQAQINPGALVTTYSFEYITEQAAAKNEEEAVDPFTGAALAKEGQLPASELDKKVSASVTGLQTGTQYRFRVFATNLEASPSDGGTDEAFGSFSTYPHTPVEPSPCGNALLRTGFSVLLPDCRAYELVTPPDTNGRAPIGTSREVNSFTNRQVSPGGEKFPFKVEGGTLPGSTGTGSQFGDPYVSSRTAGGWTTTYTGPSALEAPTIIPGSSSPDQGYSFWSAQGSMGSALIGGEKTNYVRYPDGHSEPIGQGSLGTVDPTAVGQMIGEGGTHILFATGTLHKPSVQLEPTAAPDGTRAIYDRTADGTTHVVSLKPGNEPFGAGEDAFFQGSSLDGRGVAFRVGAKIFFRYDNAKTFEIGEGVEFAGFDEGGRRFFFVEGGDLKAFDAGTEEETLFADTAAPVVPVYVAADGTAAYFVSETAVSGSGENPEGDVAQAGEQNLYLSREGAIAFVATVTARDVEGEPGPTGSNIDGLGLLTEAAPAPFPGRFGLVPARSTPDGGVLLFKSRAALGDYDPEGHAEIYRYDSAGDELQCVSCIATGAAASSDAGLQSENREGSALFFALAWPKNLRDDGRRAFFESSEALVPRDTDGLQDVYEWEDQGVGSCTRPEGCVYLISSPESVRKEYLWAVSDSGNDVFFLSSGLLVPADADETPSIYDARVGGGFPEAAASECQGEGCRPTLTPPPALPAISVLGGGGDVPPPRHCPKGKHKVKRNGKVRCVKKHKKKNGRHRRRAGAEQKGGAR
jgi:hypothetical protein